jgi:sarcosine oxidase subunit beta
MRKSRIVIIGGGVVGASVAYHLTERGAKDVLLLESELDQGRGSTGKATGGVRAQFETDINIKMSLYSIDFFKRWEVDCGYDPKGYVFFATTAEQFDYLKRNVDKQRELGVKDVDVIDRDEIRAIVPGLNCDDVAGGTFGRQDGFINPLRIMRGFTEGAVSRGAKIEFGRPVAAIETVDERVRGVRVGDEVIECETIVLCSGARAGELAATAGIDLPVAPQRRQIVWARSVVPLPADLPMVIDIGTGFHFRPAVDWTAMPPTGGAQNFDILFAYPDPDEPSSTNTDFDDSFIEKVRAIAKHRAPFLAKCDIVRDMCRAGLYENTPDHHAILGGCEVDGLYFANGFSGHGVMHSPATGRALAEMILDGKSHFLDVSCLSIDRFAKGELLHETAFI